MTSISRRRFVGAAGLLTAAAACGNGSSTVRRSAKPTRVVEKYGDGTLQVGEWFVPAGSSPAPTVLLVHGGFWRAQYDRHLEDKVALDLVGRGYLVWNIDYRSSAVPWPATLTDVAAGYDHLYGGSQAQRVDLHRVACVGHSAGGQLVAWLAGRHKLAPGAPGYSTEAKPPAIAVPQAGVVALTIAAQDNLGSGAPQALVGGTPAEQPERYHQADPIDLLPTGVRTVLVHDRNDDIVPVSQSQTYVKDATAAGDNSTLELVPGDHFSHIDPKSVACERMRAALATMSD